MASNSECLCTKMCSGLLFGVFFPCFHPPVTQRYYRYELEACSVPGCCINSASPGLLDQNICSRTCLKLGIAQESHPQEDRVITETHNVCIRVSKALRNLPLHLPSRRTLVLAVLLISLTALLARIFFPFSLT